MFSNLFQELEDEIIPIPAGFVIQAPITPVQNAPPGVGPNGFQWQPPTQRSKHRTDSIPWSQSSQQDQSTPRADSIPWTPKSSPRDQSQSSTSSTNSTSSFQLKTPRGWNGSSSGSSDKAHTGPFQTNQPTNSTSSSTPSSQDVNELASTIAVSYINNVKFFRVSIINKGCLLLPLMNSFNKSEAAVFLMQTMLPEDFPIFTFSDCFFLLMHY